MKKLNEYQFNDGVDGIIRAKNEKHACRLLGKTYHMNWREIWESVKECGDDWFISDNDWVITCDSRILKRKGIKSEYWGRCE